MGEENALILKEEKNKTLILTLNRPNVMNSLNFKLLCTLRDEITALEHRTDIRTLILTGKGNKAFCAGADLKERAGMKPPQVKIFINTIRDLFSRMAQLPIPVICAINGIALGGGTEIALASDIRFASTTASMGLTETKLAIIPGGGGTQRLPRLIGVAKAKELIFTGRRVDAKEAFDIGLINQFYPPETLLNECLKIADIIAQNGPIAVEMAKYAIDKGIETDLATGLAIESNAYRITIPTEDRLEGLAAFKEKRPPVYKGK